jgi:hypothetical protein
LIIRLSYIFISLIASIVFSGLLLHKDLTDWQTWGSLVSVVAALVGIVAEAAYNIRHAQNL